MSASGGWLGAPRRRGWRPFRSNAPPAADDAGADDGLVLLDEQTLARLRRLSLLAGRARTEGLAGEHRSRRRGTSPEFADFKRYSQGDDFRRIDWNTYARLDGLFVRLSEVTTELSVHILLDSSASMDWSGRAQQLTKFTAARRLAGALAYVALWGFDRVTITPFSTTLSFPFGPVQGRTQVVPAMRYLQQLRPLGGTMLAPAVAAYAHGKKRPGLLLLISDFLAGETDALRAVLHDLCARGWQIAVLHVVDEAEIMPEAATAWLRHDDEGVSRQSLELVDRESGAILRLAADDDVVTRYVAAVNTWLEEIETTCATEGATYARISTSWDLDDLTLALLHERGVVA